MRRHLCAIVAGAALAVTAALSGCPAAHDDYPGLSCKTDSDCYQGEHCMNASICVADTDLAAVEYDLAHKSSNSDGGVEDLATLPADQMTGADL
jgi:hypothetical protein